MLKCRQERAWAQCGMSICCAAGTAAFTQAPPRMWPGGSGSTRSERAAVHNSGRGAKYTRSRPSVTLAYTEEAPDRSAALRREAAIKKLPRRQKLELIKNGFDDPDGNGAFPLGACPPREKE